VPHANWQSDGMSTTEGQRELWNGSAGEAWAESQATTDTMFAPLAQRLAREARAGERVLDVGCGAGATTRALSEVVGPDGHATGVDISPALVAAARAHASAADYVEADAGTHPFAPASVDLVASRFGVMFFDDPVAAFANLRRATRDGGRLRAITWRAAAENRFMTTAARAARPLLGDLPQPAPGAPGQFAFADAERVRSVLTAAGWRDVEHVPLDVELAMPAAALTGYLTRLGPLSRVLPTLDPARRDEVFDVVLAAFDPYIDGDEVRFDVACWMLQAGA
jgi:SAM-dependent methyltransferase